MTMNTTSIFEQMDLNEHCQECGALILDQPGGSLCPHCGNEVNWADDEAWVLPLWPTASFRAEGKRFHLGDDRSQAA